MGVSLLPPEKRPRTKDDDEDEEDWNVTLSTYRVSTLGTTSKAIRPEGERDHYKFDVCY